MTRLGIDVSNYTGELDSAKVAALKAAGVEYAIVGTQKPDLSARQIAALEAGGIEIAGVYVFLYWDGQDEQRVKDALTFGEPVWLDCEYVVPHMPTPLDMFTRIDNAARWADKAFAGIYTGSWWWLPYTGNTQLFSSVPLWHAAYQSRPESLHLPQPYGGWTQAAIWQFSSGGIAGMNVDLDVTGDAPAPMPTPAPLPDYRDLAAAMASADHFLRNGFNLSDLSQGDRDLIKQFAGLLP